MVDILHRIGARNSSPEAAYAALTTIDGLAGWWATDTQGDTGIGDVIKFQFVPGGFAMKVRELDPPNRIMWEVVSGPAEWIGTHVTWTIRQSGEFTIILFAQLGWAEANEFMHHCSTKWATYLLSLKHLLETGAGSPDPDDIQISDWH